MAYFKEGSEAMTELEAMIDEVGPRNVAYAVARICAFKADHLESNWQNRTTARAWTKAANQWEKFAAKTESPLD